MKNKIFNYINNTPMHPIILVLFFGLIGILVMLLFRDDENSFEYFLSLIGIGISAAVVQCALIQNRIQKDNIKIQLFDKRYKVFQSVLDSITFIKRDNWDRYILFNENDANKQMILIEENLYKSVQLSACLFDKDINSKLEQVNNAFCQVAESYKAILVASIKNLISQEKLQEFFALAESALMSDKGFNSEAYNKKLEEFPTLSKNMLSYSKKCAEYLALIEKCGIIRDFGKYIVVDNLGK